MNEKYLIRDWEEKEGTQLTGQEEYNAEKSDDENKKKSKISKKSLIFVQPKISIFHFNFNKKNIISNLNFTSLHFSFTFSRWWNDNFFYLDHEKLKRRPNKIRNVELNLFYIHIEND